MATAFNKFNLLVNGDTYRYSPTCTMHNSVFVARFKRGGAASFVTFLIKNFTVEEYFEQLDVMGKQPLEILQAKGYLQPHVKKWLKEGGYPVTPEGYQQFKNASRVLSNSNLGYIITSL